MNRYYYFSFGRWIVYACLAFAFVSLVSSCDVVNTIFPPPALTLPSAYDSTNFRTNAATELRLKASLIALSDTAKTARTVARRVIPAETLRNIYTNGSPNLSDITTAWYRPRMLTNITEFAKASGGSYDPAAPLAQNGQGGVFGSTTASYLFDENGIDMQELLEKGLYGAALYNQATVLLTGDIPLQNVDKVLALFGAMPSFRNSDNVSKHGSDNIDRFCAAYAARRCDNTEKGLYRRIQNNFITLQASIKAGSAYNNTRNAAADSLLLNWERSNAASVINYCFSVQTTMSKTTTTLEDRARALHAYGEAVGFLSGWRTVSRKRITDAQVERVMTLLKAPLDGTPTAAVFITDPVTNLPALQTVIQELRGIYGFTDAEIELFRRNLVSEQMR